MNKVSQALSSHANAFSESATLLMARKSRELRAAGHDIIDMSLGEPDQMPPARVLQAAHAAIDGDRHKYPPVNGFPDLREAICTKFSRDNGLKYDPAQIVVSTGAKQAIFNTIMSLIDPGKEVVLPAPYWVSYAEQVRMAGGKPVVVGSTLEQDLKADMDEIAKAINTNTRLLIFSSPCNPSGSVFDREEMEQLAAIVADHPDLMVISDEIYEHITFQGEHISFASLPGMFDRTITVNGLSKAFAMTGWRLGYMGAPSWVANACAKMQGQVTSGANSIAQVAAIEALAMTKSELAPLRKIYEKRLELVLAGLATMPGIRCNRPQGAFYVMPEVSSYFGKRHGSTKIQNGTDLCLYLLEEGHVGMVDGGAFGAPDHVRISYATSEPRLELGMERMAQALAKLS